MTIQYGNSSQSRAWLRRWTWFLGLVVLGYLLAAVAHEQAYAADYNLSLSFGGTVGEINPADTIQSYLAGIYPQFIVRVLPVGREVAPSDYAGVLAREWPANLQVDICQRAPGDTVFVPDSDLKDQLDFHYYVGPGEARYDSIWRQTGQTPPWYDLAPAFRFPFHLPESFIGQQLCFRVVYNSERYGTLVSETPKCIMVKGPVSAWDTTLVRDDLVQHADGLQDWPVVLQLADSLISLGWASIYGLGMASGAARRLGQYDQAIYYLDLCFQRHGSISMSEGGGRSDSATERRWYEDQRARLMKLKNQQQQH